MNNAASVSMRSGGGTQPLISYDVKPSPRQPNEIDVKSYIESLQEALRGAKLELMQYKKLIE